MKSIPVIGIGWVAGDNTTKYSELTSIWDNINKKDGPLRLKTETFSMYLPNTSMRLVDRQSQFFAAATNLAYSCLDKLCIPNAEQTGISHGSFTAAVNEIIKYEASGLEKGFNTVNPMEFPNTVSNVTASRVGIWYGLKERVYALSEGVTSGLNAIGLAYECLLLGRGDAFLAGASEEIPFWIQDDCNLNILEGAISFLLCRPDLATKNEYRVLGTIENFDSNSIGYDDRMGEKAEEYIVNLIIKWGLEMEQINCFVSGCWNAENLNDVLNNNKSIKGGIKSNYYHIPNDNQSREGYTLNSMFDFAEALTNCEKKRNMNNLIISSDRMGFISCLLLKT